MSSAVVAKLIAKELLDKKKRKRLLIWITAIICVILFLLTVPVYIVMHPIKALKELSVDSGIDNQDISHISITQFSNNEDAVWYYLKGIGFNDFGASGVMGNIRAESGFRPDANNNNLYFGLCQWGGGRWFGNAYSLSSYASLKGTEWSDFQTQLEFFEIECKNSYGSVFKQMCRATDEVYACDYFCTVYEGCIGATGRWAYSMVNGEPYQNLLLRREYTKLYYKHYAKKGDAN